MGEDTRSDRKRLIWDNFVKLLHDQGINPPADRWHVVRAEQFICAFPGRKLAELGAAEVSGYLEEAGRRGDPGNRGQTTDSLCFGGN